MKPTLKGDSFGPGDAHKRAMSNYYHVQDSLPPKPLRPSELKVRRRRSFRRVTVAAANAARLFRSPQGSIMLYYDNTAPPPMPQGGGERGLLDGLTGREIPFPR